MNGNRMHRSTSTTLRGAVLTAVLLASPLSAGAEEAAMGLPGDWLARYTSARTMGLGGAFVATADDPLASVWNPAGLTQMLQNTLNLETARYFEGTSINGLSITVPARRLPTLGFTLLALNSGDFERTNELNQSLGTFSQSDMAFILSAARAINPRLSIGANLKVVREEVESFGATGVGGDVGVLYALTPRVRLGASVMNIGGPTLMARDVDEAFPLEIRGGAALGYLNGKGLLSMEVDHREGPGTSFRVGTELWLYENFGIRGGYGAEEPAGGFSYRFNPALQFDYGMTDHELGLVHFVALGYRFGGFFAATTATPAVFSPLGENSVTKFDIKSRTRAETQQWHLDIVDKHNQTVRSFGGQGTPPAHVMWDGKDESGMTLPDGIYRYRLVVSDTDGRVLRTEEKRVEITTTGPQGSVPVITE